MAVLVLATGMAYAALPAGGFSFVGWDDTTNIVNHPLVSSGSLESLSAAWTGSTLGVYEPLALSLKIFLVSFFGMRILPFHLTSVVLHAFNACLVFVLARRVLTLYGQGRQTAALRPFLGAVVAGLLFALNPIHAEVVAWASGQPYTLAVAFFLLSVHCYLSYVAGCRENASHLSRVVFLGLSFLFYICAVLSKSAAIVLPAVLLVLDYCPLRRSLSSRLLLEKLVYFGAAAGLSAVIVAATSGAQVDNSFQLDLAARITYALGSVTFHLGQAVWPARLFAAYPVLDAGVTPWASGHVFDTVAVIAGFVLAWWTRERAPWFTASWLIYVIGLLPVSGLVAHGAWIIGADRYAYLPLLGLWISLGGWVTSIGLLPRPGWRDGRSLVVVGLIGSWLLTWGFAAHRQTLHWRNTESLWRHALQEDPANPTALNNLGFEFLSGQRYAEAEPLLVRAVTLDPRHLRARLNLGVLLEKLDRPVEAIRVYRAGIVLYPESGPLHHNLGVVYSRLGRTADAQRHHERARQTGFDPGRGRLP